VSCSRYLGSISSLTTSLNTAETAYSAHTHSVRQLPTLTSWYSRLKLDAISAALSFCQQKLFLPDTDTYTDTHTHTHPFNDPLSGTSRVGRYQKGKTNLYFTEARDSEWQWHQLGHMQVCTPLQTDNHTSTPPLSFCKPDALPAAQPTVSKH